MKIILNNILLILLYIKICINVNFFVIYLLINAIVLHYTAFAHRYGFQKPTSDVCIYYLLLFKLSIYNTSILMSNKYSYY